MNPLAYELRPKTINDIVGQNHLVGPNGAIRRMINNNKIPSLILFGDPGIGKTTLAKVIVNSLNSKSDTFNASSDNKEKLKTLIEKDNVEILIIDEIHRMKKDIQDYLLPFVESGKITMIGLTTINPYRAVNPAIRSRSIIYKLYPLNNAALNELVDRCISFYKSNGFENFDLSNDTKNYVISLSNGEGRSLINNVECLYLSYNNEEINLEMAKEVLQKPNVHFDKNGDGYYDTLSGLHKSIRGSDVNASLHYMAKLLYTEDLTPLIRRLYCIFYEDISLANPSLGPRVKAACDCALELGMPEARLPFASIVVEMALSPKSNSTYSALAKAMEDIEKGSTGNIPPHLKNVYVFEDGNGTYKYPHDYPGAWVYQQYLPDNIKDAIYYEPKTTSRYEEALKERYDAINKAIQKYKNNN